MLEPNYPDTTGKILIINGWSIIEFRVLIVKTCPPSSFKRGL